MPAVIALGSNGIKWISNIVENSARWGLIQMEGGNGLIICTIQQTMGSNLDDFAMEKVITRTIATTPLVQDANIWKKKESAPNGDEASAPASVVSVEDLGMHEGMSQEEIAATQECIKYAVMLRKDGLAEEEKAGLEEGFEKAKKVLLEIRQERYDSEGKPFSETVVRANKVIKNNMKSPRYIADKKKRKSIFRSSYYGIDDPFYDGFKELYGDEGLLGYRKERLEAFEGIVYHDDVKLASQRYKKVDTILTPFKTLAIIAGLIVYFLTFHDDVVKSVSVGNPILDVIHWIIAASGSTALIIMIPTLPEAGRSSHNYEILNARLRIAKDLGLLDKKADDVEKDNYKGE